MERGYKKPVTKSSTAKICLGLMLLALGCGIYLLFRSKTLYIYVWCKSLGLSGYIDALRIVLFQWSLPDFIKYSLPDGLYCAAYLFIMDAIWREEKGPTKYIILSTIPVITISSELLQYFGFIRGTFDLADLICYTVPSLIFLMIEFKRRRIRIINPKSQRA